MKLDLDKAMASSWLWDRLPRADRPVALYGMGDGGDKILRLCREHGVQVAGVFASDAFVRGQSFQGYPVRTLAGLEAELGRELIILLAFATHRPQVLEQIEAVAARHALYAPDLPVAGRTHFTPAFAREHREELAAARALLADEASRRVFDHVIAYKLTGRIDLLRSCATSKEEAWALLRPGPGDYYVDAGAYTGDTVEEFLRHAGGARGILALEPDRRNFAKLEKTMGRCFPAGRCVQAGAWDREAQLPFVQRSGRRAGLAQAGQPARTTPFTAIDRLVGERAVTLIKYDVEGAEARALLGSRETIARCCPGLMVSAYHRSEDLFELPLLIHRLWPGYRIHLRHHPCLPAWDVNLYAF